MDNEPLPVQDNNSLSKPEIGKKEKVIPNKQVGNTDINESQNIQVSKEESINNKPSKHKRTIKEFLHNLNKKQWAIIIVIILVLLVGGGLAVYYAWFRETSKPISRSIVAKKQAPTVQPTTVASRLTGVQVSPALAKLPITGVMIENSDDARPQSGLSQAGVIFEALAEGGITRFLALYEEGQPSSIGPIRSARPYFIDWLLPFDAAYAHVGGSPDALNEVQSLNVKDMNQSYYGSYYTRITTREAPHNVYTSMAELESLEQSKGWTTSNFTGFPRKADSPSKSPTATDINFNISNSDMAVNYQYNSKNNSYERSEGGTPMIDANTGQQLDPKVVIAMVVPWTDGPLDALGAYYTDYSDIGSGTVYVFQDGIVTQGEWEKPSQASQITFTSSNGKPLRLDAGQTWLTALGETSDVSYSK